MHIDIFRAFNHILATRSIGNRVLEIGAMPNPTSLLNLPALSQVPELLGINMEEQGHYQNQNPKAQAHNAFDIIKGNANHMDCFPDSSFDTVLCNSVIEHDKYFWLTLNEIHRVAKPNALVVIGAPGYDEAKNIRLQTKEDKLRYHLNFGSRHWLNKFGNLGQKIFPGTLTVPIHNCPGDYYRFSPQAFREVIFRQMDRVEVFSIKVPPRIIGIGYVNKPESKV